jgi:mono/diheme cytochrome c family protein
MKPKWHQTGKWVVVRWARVGILLAPLLAGSAGCSAKPAATAPDPLLNAYDFEPDWNDSQHLIPLNYQQAQGKRIFYADCVWCHADATPAGPSNRANLTPTPALLNDGSKLNPLSDQDLQNIINLGGSAVGKSPTMPPWGRTLAPDEIQDVIAYARAIAQPPYGTSARSGVQEAPK